MKFLLDTHIWLWAAIDASRISPQVSKVLSDPTNELWLSSVSVWELIVLSRKGRFKTSPDIRTWVARTIAELHLAEAPLTVDVTLALASIRFVHEDPADQLLAATAKAFDLTLVTADKNLIKLPEIRSLANR
jgi:PIN domain nuclease of toxin-antitoxin system